MSVTLATVQRFGEIAPQLVDNGYLPVPIIPGTKRPPMESWQDWRYIPGSFQDYYTGLLTGHGCIACDADIREPQAAETIDKLAQQCLGKAPIRVGNWPKRLRLYQFAGEFRKQTLLLGDLGKIEMLGTGQQFVSYAIHPDTQAPFEWTTTAQPLNTACSDLMMIEQRHVDMFLRAVREAFPQYESTPTSNATGPRFASMPADERWAMHITHILEGSDLHDSLAALASGWACSGMPPGAVVQSLRAIMGQSAARTADPQRWLERYNDIPRAVSTALEKYGTPEPYQPPAQGVQLRRVPLARLKREEAPSHRLALEKWLPARKPSVMHADGGIGKTRLALQLAALFCTGDALMGMQPVVSGNVLFASAEEDEESVWTILDEIATGMQLLEGQIQQVRDKLHVLDLTREPSPILYDSKGWNALGNAVLAYAREIRPVFMVMDNASSCYAGPATEAAHIYALLNGWTAPVQDQNGSGLVLLHENKTALREENRTHAYGGIVAWNNAPRARLELTSDPQNDDARILKLAKGNYQPLSARKDGVRLVWSNGAFVPEVTDVFMQNLRARSDAQVVRDVVARLIALGNVVSPAKHARSNPISLAKNVIDVSIPDDRFWRALERCLQTGMLVLNTYKKPNRTTGQCLALGPVEA